MNQLVSLHCISLTERLATELTHEIFDSCMKSTFGTCESSLKLSGTILSLLLVTFKQKKQNRNHRLKRQKKPSFTSYFYLSHSTIPGRK